MSISSSPWVTYRKMSFFSRITFELRKKENQRWHHRVTLVEMHRNIYLPFDIERSRSKFDFRSRSRVDPNRPKFMHVMIHISRSILTRGTRWSHSQRLYLFSTKVIKNIDHLKWSQWPLQKSPVKLIPGSSIIVQTNMNEADSDVPTWNAHEDLEFSPLLMYYL